MNKSPIVIGHSGAMAYAPRNTLSSFKKALSLRTDMVEFDVQKTKDNHLVVIHDEKVDNETNGKGFVKDLTLKEIKSVIAKDNGKIPTLQEVINLLKGKCKMNIEIKAEYMEKELIEIIKKNDIEEEVIVSSFIHDSIIKIKELSPKLKVALAFGDGDLTKFGYIPLEYDNFKINIYGICPDKKQVNKKNIKEAHEKGIKVFVYTVNEEKEMLKLMEMDVDGIFTDKPDLLINLKKKF